MQAQNSTARGAQELASKTQALSPPGYGAVAWKEFPEVDATLTSLSDNGIPGGMYVPRMIGHLEADGYVHTGLIVLAMPALTDVAWMSASTQVLSHAFDANG